MMSEASHPHARILSHAFQLFGFIWDAERVGDRKAVEAVINKISFHFLLMCHGDGFPSTSATGSVHLVHCAQSIHNAAISLFLDDWIIVTGSDPFSEVVIEGIYITVFQRKMKRFDQTPQNNVLRYIFYLHIHSLFGIAMSSSLFLHPFFET